VDDESSTLCPTEAAALPGALAISSEGGTERRVKTQLSSLNSSNCGNHSDAFVVRNAQAPSQMDVEQATGTTHRKGENINNDAVIQMEVGQATGDTHGEGESIKKEAVIYKKYIIIGCGVILSLAALALIIGLAVGLSSPSSGTVEPMERPIEPLTTEIQAVRDMVAEIISPLDAFEDSESPHYQALLWAAGDYKNGNHTTPRMQTRYVLALFYFSLVQYDWPRLKRDLNMYYDQHECNWQGIVCRDGEISKLYSGGLPWILEGTIPSELNHLTGLRKCQSVGNHILWRNRE